MALVIRKCARVRSGEKFPIIWNIIMEHLSILVINSTCLSCTLHLGARLWLLASSFPADSRADSLPTLMPLLILTVSSPASQNPSSSIGIQHIFLGRCCLKRQLGHFCCKLTRRCGNQEHSRYRLYSTLSAIPASHTIYGP